MIHAVGQGPRIERCYNIHDLRTEAKRRLPKFIFEFVDRGSEDEWAVAHNRDAFQRLKLRNRALADIAERDLGTTLFNKRVSLPLAIAPTGSAGPCWYEGELALAKAAAAIGVPFTLAASSTTPLEKIAAEGGGSLWFQSYMWADKELSESMIRRVRNAGYEALIATVDVGIGNNREFNYRNRHTHPFRPSYPTVRDVLLRPGWMANVLLKYLATTGIPKPANIPPEAARTPSATFSGQDGLARWDHFSRLRDLWSGPLIIKGIARADDAVRAVELGADGVIVSNHGGRTMDSAVATIDVLPSVVAAVGDRATVMLDSGIRRGSDMVKAYALGAKVVLLGRATLYGIAAGGQAGAEHALKLLRREYDQTLAYVGCRSAGALGPDVLGFDSALEWLRQTPRAGLHGS